MRIVPVVQGSHGGEFVAEIQLILNLASSSLESFPNSMIEDEFL
jgi:hypothetical protein